MIGGRRAVVATLTALVALLGVLGVPSLAGAHGALRRTEPAAGAHLAAVPRELRLTFNEPVERAVARLQLLGPDNLPVALGPLRWGDSAAVIVADIVGPLVAGTYTVAWQITGRDGHPVRGSFRFGIAPGASGLAAPPDPMAAADTGATQATRADTHRDPVTLPTGDGFDAESRLFAAVRWLGFTALVSLIGAVGFGTAVLPAAARRTRGAALPIDDILRRTRTFGFAAGATLLVAAILRLLAQSVAMHGGAEAFDVDLVSSMLGGTRWGTGWLLQMAAASIAVLGFALLPRRRGVGWVVAATAAVAAALSASLSGHAAAVPERTVLAVSTDALHVLAAGGWLGTLLALVVVALPAALRAAPGERGAMAAALVNALSPLALACATIVALSGGVAAWLHVGSIDALTASAYGRTLLLKLAAVATVVAAGTYNWRHVRPALTEERGVGRLQRSAWSEIGMAAVVLALTAVLVATPTPHDGVLADAQSAAPRSPSESTDVTP